MEEKMNGQEVDPEMQLNVSVPDQVGVDVEKKVEDELAKLAAREAEIAARADKLPIQNEDVVMIHRHDNIDTLTFLDMAEKSMAHRRRSSWYGKIIKVSEVDSGDDVREKKKKSLKVNDIVIFNPESAYSLNIAGFEEIWILHVDSILVTDLAYDYVATRKENLRKKFEIQQAMAARAMQAAERANKVQQINKSGQLGPRRN